VNAGVYVTEFRQLNHGWNAEPNAPDPQISVNGTDVLLSFWMNPFQFPEFVKDDSGTLKFSGCVRYRLGGTNDEGWYRGQCRFSKSAPAWGDFYEVVGDLRLSECPNDWVRLALVTEGHRHFLFYLRDETFECDALDWKLTVNGRHIAGGPP
jgi:hypothetical protein